MTEAEPPKLASISAVRRLPVLCRMSRGRQGLPEWHDPVRCHDPTDQRWPHLSKNLAASGACSVLGVPLELGKDSSAALNFFAPATGLFTDAAIDEAVVFAGTAAQALRLSLRIATLDLLVRDLKAAMEHRSAIDLASGVIMEQNQCSRGEAFAMLLQASQNRNEKLHEVAEGIIKAKTDTRGRTSITNFDD
ncbi:GAF and ANTAR domain-containing protein [Arthrobacter globiformis]|uniref:GAF and ANTAR domain-containing protein n=1 Tax=Arthrobacter globiformis TaxID=1665 RepID=UPI003979030C